MALNSSTKATIVDPNFSIPPNVVDLEYRNIDEPGDSATSRSDETGDVINVDYDEASFGETGSEDASNDSGTQDTIFPPDSITVVSQTVRVGADGRTVVDVVLEIDNTMAGVTYDVRLTKP